MTVPTLTEIVTTIFWTFQIIGNYLLITSPRSQKIHTCAFTLTFNIRKVWNIICTFRMNTIFFLGFFSFHNKHETKHPQNRDMYCFWLLSSAITSQGTVESNCSTDNTEAWSHHTLLWQPTKQRTRTTKCLLLTIRSQVTAIRTWCLTCIRSIRTHKLS